MRDTGKFIFTGICLLICAFPFLGMSFNPTNTTTENRKMAVLPKIKKANGKLNINFLEELGIYFEDHFAFRPELVSLDAEIQSKVFMVSNVETVVTGDSEWLYYSSTIDDYLGRNIMSGRYVENIAHNLLLIQKYINSKGAKFIFTVAPNKNSLYGENMPYYLQKKSSNIKNIDMLERNIKKYNIFYVDLFQAFKEQEEELYLKRDSHWNQKGAVLVYNTILNSLGIEHENYENIKPEKLKNEYGDLNKMLYPVTAVPEWNYFYNEPYRFSYKTDTKSVEEEWIETENKNGTGSLLMFRDSFGNTLLPLMANTFAKGYFSKSVPQNITEYVEMYNPDIIVLEKVERNIKELATEPPLIEGIPVNINQDITTAESGSQLEISESKYNSGYIEVYGILDNMFWTQDVKIYVRVTDDNGCNIYETFYVSDNKSEYGYKLNLPKEKIADNHAVFEVIVENKGKFQIIKSMELNQEIIIKLKGDEYLEEKNRILKKRKTPKRKIVSREKIYDCDGSGRGYYIIKWSDGEVEYKDF